MKFAECEEWLWRNRDKGYPVHGVDFDDVEDVIVPSRLPYNCVAWPKGWIEDEKCFWRASMDMPGGRLHPAEADAPLGYWMMERWWKRYLEGRNKQIRKQLRRQVVRWLVGLD